jgi:organic hydroperoxide reductase OsmC/OhrA
MQDFPHHYKSTASARRDSNVELTSPGLDALESAGPAEFGGPGDRWSPETLLSAAIADCFILSFRAVARAAKLEWISIRCDVAGSDEAKAMRLLEKAEHVCLITNSLKGIAHLDASVRVVD